MKRMLGIMALSLAAMASAARAEIKDMLPRLPAAANAVVAINVNSVMSSAIAKAQGWGTKEDAPLFLQLGATNVLMASKINLSDMDSSWEVGLMELGKTPSMPGIALSEGGFADTIGDLSAVWSARKVYFMLFDKQLLAVSSPDDRQFAVRWARSQAGATRPLIAEYLQKAAVQATDKTGIVMALDLQDAIGLNKVRRNLMTDLSRATLLKDSPVDDVAKLLATLRGITVKFQFTDAIDGQIQLEFEKDPSLLMPVASGLLKNVLAKYGLGLDDLDSWTPSSEGTKLSFAGKISVPSFMKVMMLIETPAPNSMDAPAPKAASGTGTTPGTGTGTSEDAKALTIAASQKYFKAISATLDSFSQPTSAGAGAAWLKRAATRIDQLSLVNVDSDLLNWGTYVSGSLLNGSQQLANGQVQISAASVGAKGANMGEVGSSVYYQDENGNYQAAVGDQVRHDFAKQVAAMEQASQDTRARVTAPVGQLLADVLASRSKMRVLMVERYKVNF